MRLTGVARVADLRDQLTFGHRFRGRHPHAALFEVSKQHQHVLAFDEYKISRQVGPVGLRWNKIGKPVPRPPHHAFAGRINRITEDRVAPQLARKDSRGTQTQTVHSDNVYAMALPPLLAKPLVVQRLDVEAERDIAAPVHDLVRPAPQGKGKSHRY